MHVASPKVLGAAISQLTVPVSLYLFLKKSLPFLHLTVSRGSDVKDHCCGSHANHVCDCLLRESLGSCLWEEEYL